MNRSSNACDGPLSTSIKVTKQQDGTYVAQPIGFVGTVVQPVVAHSESVAINLCKQALQSAAEQGKI